MSSAVLQEKKVYQSNSLVFNSSYDMNSFDRNLLNIAGAKLKPLDQEIRKEFEYFNWEKDIVPDKYKIVIITYKDLDEGFGYRFTKYDKAFERYSAMKDIDVKMSLGATKGQGVFVSDVYHHKDEAMFRVILGDIAVKHMLAIFLPEHKGFTQISMHPSNLLKGKYAKRIYDLLSNLKTRNSKKKKLLIEDLVHMWRLKQDIKWGHIRETVLDPSIREIGEKTEIKPAYEIIKKSRRVVGIVLYINKIDMGVIEIPFIKDFNESSNINNSADPDKIQRMTAKMVSLGFSEKEVSFYCRQMSVEVFWKDINTHFQYTKTTIHKRDHKKWYKKKMDIWISGPGHTANK